MPNPGAADDFLAVINPESLVIKQGYAEPSLAQAEAGKAYQFEREGYFCLDSRMQAQPIWCSTAPSGCVILGRKRANNISFRQSVAPSGAFFVSESAN